MSVDGLGLSDADRTTLGVVRRHHPLGGHRLVRLAARPSGRDQPPRPDPHRRALRRARRHARTSSPCPPATSPATGVAAPPRSSSAKARSTSDSTGARRSPAARRLRGDSEAASRKPPQLAAFAKAARTELGAAGAPALSAKTEQLRVRWVRDQLVEAGRSRAASLGWPDAYAYTKALGEQALTDSRGDVPVSIVRPSIIESAYAEPRPGWIRGFRMAEPVIISYARGLLREFPGVPEGTVDVIPVDMVVAAIIAVAGAGPERAPAITQVASGGINPLKYRTLVDNVSSWFGAHPLYDAKGQPIMVPEWRFPGGAGSSASCGGRRQ
ncbi:MAG: SDR family oxidoreductase [Ilumatobacteraceae bacterium]